MKTNIIKRFKKFMHSHGVTFFQCSQYTYGCMQGHCECTPDPKNYIIAAFCWNKTSEGHDYWENLHHLWVKELEDYVVQ